MRSPSVIILLAFFMKLANGLQTHHSANSQENINKIADKLIDKLVDKLFGFPMSRLGLKKAAVGIAFGVATSAAAGLAIKDISSITSLDSIRTVHGSNVDWRDIFHNWKAQGQAVLVKGAVPTPHGFSGTTNSFNTGDKANGTASARAWWMSPAACINEVMTLEHNIMKSWCVENSRPTGSFASFSQLVSDFIGTAWYASFVLQYNRELLQSVLTALPLNTVAPQPILDEYLVQHADAVWFFFGRNMDGLGPLKGRVVHTDEVSHSATWHLQVAGRKVWTIRPSDELMAADGLERVAVANGQTFTVAAEPGDLLMLNTRLWLHSTQIPNTEEAADSLSFSYARDIFFADDVKPKAQHHAVNELATNVFIPEGSIVFDEYYLSRYEGYELPTSSDPTCILNMKDDGSSAWVACRDIHPGEAFTTAIGENGRTLSRSAAAKSEPQ
eukprot:gnl/MRDRNA2_/MRDRNA2_46905_c0_seq1.p1 gnl/MRDRNA2_/MRDRNA2_46905_c0~~gnl/MRDRNA2_/MRDRNA2_46905_c0_seq1.p1  ORF type:complete len:443 (-),score=60.95 gnl/MRDRNA2_/MRDRNA2_46905_c0_seq1:487-1815(-)